MYNASQPASSIFPSLFLVIYDILQSIVQLFVDIYIAPILLHFTHYPSSTPTPRLARHVLQPTPLNLHPPRRDIGQRGKRVLRHIQIPRSTPDAAIDDFEIHADGATRAGALDAHALAAQRVRVRVGAGADGVEEEVRDGDDGVAVGGHDAARAQARRVVRQVAGVGSAVGGGERQVLGAVGAVREAGGEADDEHEEEGGGANGEEDQGAAGEGAPGSGSGSESAIWGRGRVGLGVGVFWGVEGGGLRDGFAARDGLRGGAGLGDRPVCRCRGIVVRTGVVREMHR